MLGHVANSWTLLNIYELVHLIGDSLIKLSIFFLSLLARKGHTFVLTWTNRCQFKIFFSLIVVIFLTNHILFS